MIVNLYVDHVMARPPASAEEVWNATREQATVFSAAAKAIGLTGAEYREFRAGLLDGKAVLVRLPRRFEAMSSRRRGYVYAIKNAQLVRPEWGWKVALGDGTIVYVPRTCGNLSLNHRLQFAHVTPPFTPAIATVPPQLVDVTPPAAVAAQPVVTALLPAVPVPFVPVAPAFCWYCFLPLGGLFAIHGPSTVPSCSQGSNATGVCSGK